MEVKYNFGDNIVEGNIDSESGNLIIYGTAGDRKTYTLYRGLVDSKFILNGEVRSVNNYECLTYKETIELINKGRFDKINYDEFKRVLYKYIEDFRIKLKVAEDRYVEYIPSIEGGYIGSEYITLNTLERNELFEDVIVAIYEIYNRVSVRQAMLI